MDGGILPIGISSRKNARAIARILKRNKTQWNERI
jgi:hypothetical protein